jgi:Fic family protein
VRNYVAALRLGAARIAEGAPLSLSLVKEIHSALMDGLQHASPGAFRSSQVWIGAPGSPIGAATYVPPPPVHTPRCLEEWETFVQQRDQLPDLVQCALMHEHFEAIHPFADGNGRVGRILITLFLLDRQRLSRPLLYLSDYIERHRSDYYRLLTGMRTEGAWADWLRFFLIGVREAADAAIARAGEIMDLRESYTWMFHGKHTALGLVDALFENPYTTVAHVGYALNLSTPTARSLVGHFVERGILKNLPESRWGKLYVAGAILEAMGAGE